MKVPLSEPFLPDFLTDLAVFGSYDTLNAYTQITHRPYLFFFLNEVPKRTLQSHGALNPCRTL